MYEMNALLQHSSKRRPGGRLWILLLLFACVAQTACAGSDKTGRATSTTAELDLALDIIMAEYHCGDWPKWLWELSISANTTDLTTETQARRIRVDAEVREIKRRHFVDTGLKNRHLGARYAWVAWLDHKTRAGDVTTASLVRTLNRRLKRTYDGIGLPIPAGAKMATIRCRMKGFPRCFSTLRDLGLPVKAPDNLRGELMRSFVALYDEGTTRSWRRFIAACHAAKPGPGARWVPEFRDQYLVFPLVESVPPRFLAPAKDYLESLTPCVGTPWWMATAWGESYRNLRTRRAIHFPGSEGDGRLEDMRAIPPTSLRYCEEEGFTSASLPCARGMVDDKKE